jgi:hypothetical protein
MSVTKDIYNAYIGLPKDDLNESFVQACRWGKTLQVKCLLENTEFSKYIDVHYNDDHAFALTLDNSKREVLSYLIQEYQIEKTEKIKEYLEEYSKDSNLDIIGEAINMFELRELNEQLNSELSKNNSNAKKAKL